MPFHKTDYAYIPLTVPVEGAWTLKVAMTHMCVIQCLYWGVQKLFCGHSRTLDGRISSKFKWNTVKAR